MLASRSLQVACFVGLLALGGCVAAPPPMAAQPPCRQFTQTVTVNGASQLGYGYECLQADGSWTVVAPAMAAPQAPPAGSAPPAVVTYPYPVPYPTYVPYYAVPYYDEYPWYFGPAVSIGVGIGDGGGWRGGRVRPNWRR